MWYVLLLIACIAGDQLLKYWVVQNLDVGQSAALLPGLVRLTRLHNTGAAWGSFSGKTALLADDFSEMEIVSQGEGRIPDTFPYFSLLNISGTAKGVTIRDAKYPLNKAEITCDYAYGVSNEPLPGKTAAVTVDEGRLLLIRDRK